MPAEFLQIKSEKVFKKCHHFFHFCFFTKSHFLCMPICIGVFVFGNSNDGRKFLLVTDEYPCSLIFPPLQSARPALKKIWLTNKNSHTIQLSTLFLSLLSKLIIIALHFDETWKNSTGHQDYSLSLRTAWKPKLWLWELLMAEQSVSRECDSNSHRVITRWFTVRSLSFKLLAF